MRFWLILSASVLLGTASSAELAVSFSESAPKDRFRIENLSGCPLMDAQITLDMTASAGGLIFDVTGAGAGVSVYQPFEVETGAQSLQALPAVLDGDTALRLSVSALPSGGAISFTIDVDDTRGSSPTRVAGGEIAGTRVFVETAGTRAEATFNKSAQATVALPPCPTA